MTHQERNDNMQLHRDEEDYIIEADTPQCSNFELQILLACTPAHKRCLGQGPAIDYRATAITSFSIHFRMASSNTITRFAEPILRFFEN